MHLFHKVFQKKCLAIKTKKQTNKQQKKAQRNL